MKLQVQLGPDQPLKTSRYLATVARHILDGVVAANMLWIAARRSRGQKTPLPYQAGVRYQEEPAGQGYEEFADIPTVWRRGWGDCDDLAPWVCAVRRAGGENCKLRISWRKHPKTGQRIFHVTVRRENGAIEDPSRLLGMKGF